MAFPEKKIKNITINEADSMIDSMVLSLAEAAASAQQQPGFGAQLFALGGPILIIVVMFYFMFRSQKKEQKRREEMIGSIKSGDKILTVGGIYGIVSNVKDDCLVVKIADSVKVEVAKSAVSAVDAKDSKAVEAK